MIYFETQTVPDLARVSSSKMTSASQSHVSIIEKHFLTSGYKKVFKSHFTFSQLQPWNQPFLQRSQSLSLNDGIHNPSARCCIIAVTMFLSFSPFQQPKPGNTCIYLYLLFPLSLFHLESLEITHLTSNSSLVSFVFATVFSASENLALLPLSLIYFFIQSMSLSITSLPWLLPSLLSVARPFLCRNIFIILLRVQQLKTDSCILTQ